MEVDQEKDNCGKQPSPAIEFLLTYGWAILVVLLVIGALAYFGVLDTDTFEMCNDMSLKEAKGIMADSECSPYKTTTERFCNQDTNTWWIGIDAEKEGCNPACVVNTQTKTAQINWRCTGALPPE